jgi:RNA polymerase sigma-70 factor (ECF subfamily)
VIERLHAEFAGRLERIAWAVLRDWPLSADAVQETFALFSQRFAEIPNDNQRGWLVKTVQFQAQNLRRKQRRADDLPKQFASSGLVREGAAEYRVEQADEQARLREAIARLPGPQQEVVRLRLSQELSFAEIAVELDLPLGTVLSRMRLALGKLRVEFKS